MYLRKQCVLLKKVIETKEIIEEKRVGGGGVLRLGQSRSINHLK